MPDWSWVETHTFLGCRWVGRSILSVHGRGRHHLRTNTTRGNSRTFAISGLCLYSINTRITSPPAEWSLIDTVPGTKETRFVLGDVYAALWSRWSQGHARCREAYSFFLHNQDTSGSHRRLVFCGEVLMHRSFEFLSLRVGES